MKVKNVEDNIREEWQDITPEWASMVLTKHYKAIEGGKFRQRSITQAVIVRYAAEMTNGNWLLSPDPIAFDVNDHLINGQHRLEAVRKSGKTIRMKVSYGWPAQGAANGAMSTIDIIDGCKPRSVAALLQLHGVQHATNYASSVRFMARIAHAGSSSAMGVSQMLHFLDKMDLRTPIDRIMSRAKGFRDFQGRTVGPIAYYFTTKPNKAMAFAEGIFQLNFDKGSAIPAFLNWERNRTTNTVSRLKAISSAIRSWDEGKQVEVLKPTVEAMEWLANTNPELRALFRKMCPRL